MNRTSSFTAGGLVALFVACSAIAPATIAADPWYWPPTMAVHPANPTANDVVTITLSGEWPDACRPNESQVAGPAQGRLDFGVVAAYPANTICAAVITSWQRSESVGPLAPGTYQVFASLYQWGLSTPSVGPTHVGSFTVVAAWARGDTNCDGAVNFADIDPFVMAIEGQAVYQAHWPECRWLNADCNLDGRVSFSDIDPFVACIIGEPYVANYSNSGCPGARDGRSLGCEEPDEVVLTASSHALHVLHRNATYNCCPDDIVIGLSAQGFVLHLVETEILTTPCYCICCYDVDADILGLRPGFYTVEFCWDDWETGQTQCVTQEIEIP